MNPSAPLPPAIAALPNHCVRPLATMSPAALRALAAQRGERLVEVPLADCANKEMAMAALARAFAFPDWFGANLDALYDALTDLPATAGWVVVLENLLVNGLERDTRDAILDVFRDAADDFADRGIPFRVFYG
ncbi:MAG: barstar family protein [Burkholderiaceae bacterium]